MVLWELYRRGIILWLRAYNKMIESFENNLFESQWNSEGDICTIIENLADARHAASIYLNENSRLLSDKIGIG